MPSFLKSISIFLFIATIYGCSNNLYITDNNIKINKASDYGLVVLSLNIEGLPQYFYYTLESADGSIKFRIPEYSFLENMAPMQISDFDHDRAKLLSLKLPAGTYKFIKWHHSYTTQYTTYKTQSKNGAPVFFNVKNGNISYIGQISRIKKYEGDKPIGFTIKVTDKSERDLSLFLKQHPNIKLDNISKILAYKKGST